MEWLSIIIFAIAMFSGGAMIGCIIEQGRQRRLHDLRYGLAWRIVDKQKEHCKDCPRFKKVLDEV